MAVSFLEEPRCRFEKAIIISNSEHLPDASKAKELAVADDIKESNECDHFTIRGYVAEVRKSDAKKCFPFLLHNCVSLEPANAFPPLHVSKFRRWSCQSCVFESIAATDQVDIEGAMSIHNKYLNSNNDLLLRKDAETSQLDAGKAFPRTPLILDENHLKEMLAVKDSSVRISRVGKEGNELLQGDLIKEGVQNYKDGQDCQAQTQDAIEVNCLSYGHNFLSKGRRGKFRDSVGRKKIRIAYIKDSLNASFVKNKRSELQKVGCSKMLDGDATSIRIFRLCCSKEDRVPESKREEKLTSNNVTQGHTTIDMVVEKDVQDIDPTHTFSLGASCHHKRACEMSVDNSKDMGLTDGERQLRTEAENNHIKKIRKFRLLEDIIRSEKQHMTRDRNILDDNAKIIQHDFMSNRATTKEKVLLLNYKSQDAHLSNISKYDRGKGEIQSFLGEDKVKAHAITLIDGKSSCVHQQSNLKSFKGRNEYENDSEVVGPSFMHWVNNMHKNENGFEGEADMKHIENNSIVSNFSADLSGGKDQDLNVRDNGMTTSKQKLTFRKQNLGLNGGQLTSSIVICEDMKSKKKGSQDISINKNVITEKTPGNLDGTGGKEILHLLGIKRPYGDQEIKHEAKDSLTHNYASFNEWEKVSKTPRSNRIIDQESIDDIPMDIVELLARNQQERFHLKAGTDPINKLMFPSKTESIKCSFDVDSSQLSRNNKVDAEQGNLLCQNFQVKNKGFDVWTKFPCTNVINHEPKDYSCSINGKKKLQIDLNQHHIDPLISGAGFCKDININCHQLSFSCCRRGNMHSLQSCLEDQVSGGNLSRNPYHIMLQHRNGAPFGGKNHFLNNSNASVPGSNLEIFAHSDDFEKPRNLVGNHHYWGSSPAAPTALAFMDSTNCCHSNFVLPDLYSNRTVSALNLLRLMDQAAWSGEPQPHFQNHSGIFEETDVCVNGQYNELQLEHDRENETCMFPLELANPITGQQPRNSCLLFRPLPRIGSLGPSLEKEIFNYANYSSTPTRNSHGFLKTDAKEKINTPNLSPNTCLCDSHGSLFRYKCSEKTCSGRDHDRCSTSNTRCSVAKVGATRELNNRFDALLSPRSLCKAENCVVNRNPAEFTVLDENNDCMIEIKELKHKSLPRSPHGPLHGQKKQSYETQ